jgi:hypothetical protein
MHASRSSARRKRIVCLRAPADPAASVFFKGASDCLHKCRQTVDAFHCPKPSLILEVRRLTLCGAKHKCSALASRGSRLGKTDSLVVSTVMRWSLYRARIELDCRRRRDGGRACSQLISGSGPNVSSADVFACFFLSLAVSSRVLCRCSARTSCARVSRAQRISRLRLACG